MVRSFRIAILVFALGASALNLVAAFARHAEIGRAIAPGLLPQVCSSWDEPRCRPDPYATPGSPDYNDAQYQLKLGLHRVANARAFEYEIAILTITGIAWFLVAAQVKA